LSTHSSLRKDLRKLIANTKGFSSVIGTTFMVLVMLVLASSIFLWTLSQNTEYFQSVKEKNQLEVDRLNERLTAENVTYTGSGVISVEVDVRNECPLFVNLTTLWMFDVNIGKYGVNDTLNIDLKPGEKLSLRGSKAINVIINGSNAGHIFNSWFITARGNAVPLEGGIIVAQVSAGIGAVAMDFSSFKYYNVSKVGSSYILVNYPNGAEGYTVPYGQDIAFEVYLTNFDEHGRDIKLNSSSLLWVLFPVNKNQPFTRWWYIVNVSANGTIDTSFSSITLPYRSRTAVFFASSNDMSNSPFAPSSIGNPIPAGQLGAMNLLLIGRIDGSAFGQNIPFVSIYER